ncbi:MAG: hypothetical protein B6242_00710 [Anaerolineaceae bacterium 4572_78]|nr:MAG: hypothetical protein B6242_00710 [Anaerolineaceae bacterium 4572_78]
MYLSARAIFGIMAIIIALFFLCCVVSLAITGLFVKLPASTPVAKATMRPPPIKIIINHEDIDPALAMASLAGVSDSDVVNQATHKARPGTALATIVYSPEIPAGQAVGYLLLLGENFADRQNLAYTKLSYKLAGTLATLSPDLGDTTRADTFTQIGIGLTKLDEPILAKFYLDQAFLLATESRFLQSARRQAILTNLHQAYVGLNLEQESKDCLKLSMQPAQLENLPEKNLLLPKVQKIAFPPDIQKAEADRWKIAQDVAKGLVELDGTTNSNKIIRLKNALLIEDELKRVFFDEALRNESQLSNKVDIIQSKIIWQSVKYRIATKGFGISLVPEWDDQVNHIRAELKASYEERYQLYHVIAVSIPVADDIVRAEEERIRRQILAGQLGQYPGYPTEQLNSQLFDITRDIAQTQPYTKLHIGHLTVADTKIYAFVKGNVIIHSP